jgi:hypothetical protein
MAPRTLRARLLVFAVIALVMLGFAAVYVIAAVRRGGTAAAQPIGSARLYEHLRAPHVLFRHLEVEPADGFGHVAVSPLDPATGARALTGLRCVRVHYAAGRGICLEMEDENARKALLRTFGPDLTPRWALPLEGLPSRARVSPDGRLGAVTVFVTGHSYSDGAMSTRTTLLDLEHDRVLVDDLEGFEVFRDGARVQAADFNFWGVTFAADGRRFHATLSSGQTTWLVEGDVLERKLRTLRENVECPSRSPDGTRLAFKKRVGGPGTWRLHVLELATMQERALDEERPIDDQVEWLDDERILYKHGPSLYVLPVSGGAPRPFLTRASSPAVVRDAR